MTRKKNPTLTNEEYKNMTPDKLIKTFMPIIINLSESFGDDRFNEDVKQDVILELLKRQEIYDVVKYNTPFTFWIVKYLRVAAKKSRQMNFGSIYIPYSSWVWRNSKNIECQLITKPIDEFNDSSEFSYTLKHKKESELFSILKIICVSLRNSDLGTAKKDKIRIYLKELLESGKSKKILNDNLKELLKNTVLSNK